MTWRRIEPSNWPTPTAYSHGIAVSGPSQLVFLSGQTGTDRATNAVPSRIEDQTQQAFKNIETLFREVGLELTDMVRTTIYLTRQEDVAGFREARTVALGGHRPASTLLFVSALSDPRHRLEVDVVGIRGNQLENSHALSLL